MTQLCGVLTCPSQPLQEVGTALSHFVHKETEAQRSVEYRPIEVTEPGSSTTSALMQM